MSTGVFLSSTSLLPLLFPSPPPHSLPSPPLPLPSPPPPPSLPSSSSVVWVSLIVQNGLVALCSLVLALMFNFDWNVCQNVAVFSSLVTFVILLAAAAKLATVTNTISIERDWVVVVADGHENTLASKMIMLRLEGWGQ